MQMDPKVFENTCKTCNSLQYCIDNGVSCSLVADYIECINSEYDCIREVAFSVAPDKMRINKDINGNIKLSFYNNDSWLCDSFLMKEDY